MASALRRRKSPEFQSACSKHLKILACQSSNLRSQCFGSSHPLVSVSLTSLLGGWQFWLQLVKGPNERDDLHSHCVLWAASPHSGVWSGFSGPCSLWIQLESYYHYGSVREGEKKLLIKRQTRVACFPLKYVVWGTGQLCSFVFHSSVPLTGFSFA